ncbi:putative holin-like toxin [Brevibacillus laterosporus]
MTISFRFAIRSYSISFLTVKNENFGNRKNIHVTIVMYNRIGSSRAVGSLTLFYPNREGGENMEVYQALSLMFMFGMFILALLTYLKKK